MGRFEMTDKINNESEIVKRLDILIKLSARNLIVEKSLKEQVILLNSIGLTLKQIAEIVNKKPTDIGQYLYRKKKTSVEKK